MDKRKEKYYNYVISDLVSKTEIEHEQGKISLPFTFSLSYDTFFYYSLSFDLSPSFYSPSLITFSSYLKERYGAQDEETQIIWELYKERIETIINNG
tara:strand:+ start:589 stop:879 length:291 start_codon:yes stop_codon:yes gene_type:complete